MAKLINLSPSVDEEWRINRNSYSTIHSSPYPLGSHRHTLDSYFSITARGSTIRKEVIGGAVTWVTMVYIVIVNAAILSAAGTPDDPFPATSIMAATALSSALATLLVGVWANLPFGLAPGMGLNTYCAHGVCLQLGLSWRVSLTCSFLAGLGFLLLAMSGACAMVQQRAPLSLKKAVTVGLGLMQALLALHALGIVMPAEEGPLALGSPWAPRALLGMATTVLLAGLLALGVEGAALLAMGVAALLAWGCGLTSAPASLLGTPSLHGTALALDFTETLRQWPATMPVVLVLLAVCVADTAGVHFALGHQAGLLRGGHLPGSSRAFAAAAVGTMAGACMGTSPVIIHSESCAGVATGARTGLSAAVTALLFLLALPLTPLLAAVPPEATAAPMVVVGMLMCGAARYIAWDRVQDAFPAFVTLGMMAFSLSIATGIAAGAVAWVSMLAVERMGRLCGLSLEGEEEEEEMAEAAVEALEGLEAPVQRLSETSGRAEAVYVDGSVLLHSLSPTLKHRHAWAAETEAQAGVAAGSAVWGARAGHGPVEEWSGERKRAEEEGKGWEEQLLLHAKSADGHGPRYGAV